MGEPTLPGNNIPEADLIEQHTALDDADDATGVDLFPAEVSGARDANDADRLEQAIIVPLPDDERAEDRELDS